MSVPLIPGIELYEPGNASMLPLTVVSTSGTTGVPKVLVRPTHLLTPHIRERYCTYGNVVEVMGRKSLSFRNVHDMIIVSRDSARRRLPLSPELLESAALPALLADFAPTDLAGNSALMYKLTQTLERFGGSSILATVKKIYAAIGVLEPLTYRILRRHAPNADFIPAYATTEVALIARGCSHLSRVKLEDNLGIATIVHPFFPTKIDAPDERGVGEICLNIDGQTIKTGDAGRLDHIPCDCGEAETLYIYGRLNNDRIPCAGAVFLAEEVGRVMHALEPYVADYRLEVGEKEFRGNLIGRAQLFIIPTKTLETRLDAGTYIQRAFAKGLRVTPSRSLAELVQEGLFADVEVTFVQTFGSGKPLRLRRSILDSTGENPSKK